MSSRSSSEVDIDLFLKAQHEKKQLRFITCGSVDDGKSTLLGRLLHDSKNIFEDQLSATESESQKYGTQGDNVDLALLVDGLQAEREQGITIDVAYRYFATDKRKFIAADTPGHEQYTRNMATAASTAELAIILVDARKGPATQTWRHSYIASLLGIRQVVLAVNKMDLVDYQQSVFDEIVRQYATFAQALDVQTCYWLPISALTGENIFTASSQMPWYQGPSLMEVLENTDIPTVQHNSSFRLPVQWVNRPNPDFRGFSGLVASGTIQHGDAVVASLSGKTSTVKQIVGPSGTLESVQAGQSITIVLDDEIDISRGDILASPEQMPDVADQFAAHIVWMSEEVMLPERRYIIRFATARACG